MEFWRRHRIAPDGGTLPMAEIKHAIDRLRPGVNVPLSLRAHLALITPKISTRLLPGRSRSSKAVRPRQRLHH